MRGGRLGGEEVATERERGPTDGGYEGCGGGRRRRDWEGRD